jgi:hypothetical protein
METTKQAADLKVGDVVIEHDGCLLEVGEVSDAGGKVHLKLKSFGASPNPSATLRRTAMVRVFVAETL